MITKYTKVTFNAPIGLKIDQMAITSTILQDPPNVIQIWIFGLKIKPSGNPAHNSF
jgi:hypothetical protein